MARESPPGSADVSALADLAAGYRLVNATKTVPVGQASMVPLVVAALLPLAAVAWG